MMDGWMDHTNGCYVCSSAFFLFFDTEKRNRYARNAGAICLFDAMVNPV